MAIDSYDKVIFVWKWNNSTYNSIYRIENDELFFLWQSEVSIIILIFCFWLIFIVEYSIRKVKINE